MSEIVFPFLGAGFVLLCVLPLCALAAKGLLFALESQSLGGPLRHVNLKYGILTGSSLLPIAWFVSAGLHQAEAGGSGLACLFTHDDPASCVEAALFALLLAAVVGVAWYRTQRLYALVDATPLRAGALAARIDRLLVARSDLGDLRGRVRLIDVNGFTFASRGVLRRGVLVGAAFAQTLSDDVLCSALGHERQHLRAFDPLRYWLLEFSLAINPFGRFLLANHALLWNIAREAQCDRQAVVDGTAPLALADAIVRAARPASRSAVALSVDDTAVVRLRVGLLVAFSETAPVPYHAGMRSAIPVPLILFGLALLLPHQTGTEALDAVHSGTEQAMAHFLSD